MGIWRGRGDDCAWRVPVFECSCLIIGLDPGVRFRDVGEGGRLFRTELMTACEMTMGTCFGFLLMFCGLAIDGRTVSEDDGGRFWYIISRG